MEQRHLRKGPQSRSGHTQKVELPKTRLQQLSERVKQDKRWRLSLLAVVIIGGSLLLRLCSESPPTQLAVVPSASAPTVAEAASPKNKEQSLSEDLPTIAPTIPSDDEIANPSVILNAIRLTPSPAFVGEKLRVESEISSEGEEVQLTYRWLHNGQLIHDTVGETLDTSGFARKDRVEVEMVLVTLDGEKSLGSATIILGNYPPQIRTTPAASLTNGQYIYAVKATDAENDPLTYSLENAPAGMTIDSTGLVEWKIPDGIEGQVSATIVVSDGEARALQILQLNFSQSNP